VDRFVRRTGSDEQFWADLARTPMFAAPGVLEDMRLSLQLALLTQNNLPLMRRWARCAGMVAS
jgi:hypothetical protein